MIFFVCVSFKIGDFLCVWIWIILKCIEQGAEKGVHIYISILDTDLVRSFVLLLLFCCISIYPFDFCFSKKKKYTLKLILFINCDNFYSFSFVFLHILFTIHYKYWISNRQNATEDWSNTKYNLNLIDKCSGLNLCIIII